MSRKVRVAGFTDLCGKKPRTVQDNLEWSGGILDLLAYEKPDGLVLNRQGVYQKWVMATLDLDNPVFHLDYQFDKMEQVRKDYGPAVSIRVYEEEGWWRILPQRDDVDIVDIIKKYELESLEAYLARSTQTQIAARYHAYKPA